MVIELTSASSDVLEGINRTLGNYKATVEDALSGVNDFGWMTPYTTAQVISATAVPSVTTEPITVVGQPIGSYSLNEVIPAGTLLSEIITKMLTTVVAPSYASPSISLTTSATTTIEIGSNVSPVFTGTFNQNDAGDVTSNMILKKNGTTIYTSSNSGISYQEPSFQASSTYTYIASIDYGDGAIKNDNTGKPSPAGRITAGTQTSNQVVIDATRRRAFYGTPASLPLSSADVRSLSHSVLGPSSSTTFEVSISAGSVHVVIAYPATIGALQTITHKEGMYAEIKDVFTLTTISVAGANSYSPISYNMYTYTPAAPFSQSATYIVTL